MTAGFETERRALARDERESRSWTVMPAGTGLPSRAALDRARASRDPRFDGKFFIAVRTTGIYCRPVCPVRSPKRSNIRYFATAAAAAAAGYRPCLRCRPEAAPGTPAWLGTSAIVRRGLRLIGQGLLDEASVETLAATLGIGARHLHRLFVQHVGASPLAVAQTRRLHFAKRLLDETSLRLSDIALAAGFGSVRRFNDVFQRTYGRPPRELRRRRRAPEAAEITLRLAYRPPYDWDGVRDFLARRALPGVEEVTGICYRRTVRLADGHAIVRVGPAVRTHELELAVRGAPAACIFQLAETARRMFDLAADPARIAAVLAGDPLLAPLVGRRPGLRLAGAWDPLECAVRAVLGQQVTVAAGRTLAARLVARAGLRIADGDGLTHLFPSAVELAGADLEGLGITGVRVRAIHALARAVADGRLDFSAPTEQVIATVAALPGYGEWTAQYLALRGLGEPDAFPAGDLVLRRAVTPGGYPLTPRALEARSQVWRPWRAYAVLHLWGAAAEPDA